MRNFRGPFNPRLQSSNTPVFMLHYFQEIYQQVAEYLRTKGLHEQDVVQVNPKGDQTKAFDYNSEEMILEYFEKNLPFPVKVWTEERGIVRLGSGAPEYMLIIDPVDGSDNFTRDLGTTGFSVAAVPADKPLSLDNVKFGLVGHIFLQKVFHFAKGQGAFCNGKAIKPSQESDLQKALVSLYPIGRTHDELRANVPLMHGLTNLRCFGSAAYEISQVAAGGLDAFIDVRKRLTPENFMAAAPMLLEVGGIVTDECGDPLPPFERLDSGYNFIASGNRKLHDAILEYVG